MHIHVVTASLPPHASAGAKSFFKLLYPLNRDEDFELEITAIAAAQLEGCDESLLPYLAEFQIHRVNWSGQSLFKIGNRLLQLYTDDYYLFARASRKALLRHKPADLYLLRGQYFSTFLLAPFIVRRLRRPVLLYYSDPWLQNAELQWTPALRRRCARFEAEALRCAAGAIFTCSENAQSTLRHYQRLDLPNTVIPHAYLPELYPQVAASGCRAGDQIIFTYAGHFYGARQPHQLFAALAPLRRKHPELAQRIRLQIIGPAPENYRRKYETYQRELTELGWAGQVRFLGQLEYVDTLKILSASDVLINIDAGTERSLILPSKVVDYLGSKRPIWTISPPGPASALVERYGGVVTNMTEVQNIEKDFVQCATRTLEKSWNLDYAFAESFASRNVYPKFKLFLETIAAQN